MHYVNKTVLSANDDVSRNGTLIDANQICAASFHFVFSDTDAAGSVKIQASNDEPTNGGQLSGQFTPTNWINIPNQTATVVAGAPQLLTIAQTSYRWLRVTFTETTPGTGTITCNMFALYV